MQETLNEAQQKVVNHEQGPMLVVAGAGTGKTKVIVERIAKLIENGVEKSQILAVTFTEKAAQEMLDRVSNRLHESYGVEIAIHTYNAFGHQLLEEFAVEIGLSRNQKLVGEEGKVVFMREHLDALELDYFAPVSRPDGQLSTLADYFSTLKQQLVTPETYETYAQSMSVQDEAEQLEKKKHQELARAYKNYLQLMRERNIIDYDDQMYLVIELLRKRPNIRKKLQNRYRHIMVDEFQDTNPMQSALIDLLYAHDDSSSLMVVGDDDQAIYGWRGATLSNILEFSERYPDYSQTTLITNYRTTQEILDCAWKLIQENNPERLEHLHSLDKRLKAHRGSGAQPQALAFLQRDSEMAWVAEDIKNRISSGQDPGSIAILGRSKHAVADIHAMLDVYEVEHAVAGLAEELFEQPIIRMMVDALHAVWSPTDNTAIYHTITSRLFDCDATIVSAVAHEANIKKVSLHQLLLEHTDEQVRNAAQKITVWHERINATDIRTFSYEILTESGLKTELYDKAQHDIRSAQEVQTLSQWFKSLAAFEQISLTPSVLSYLENFPVLRAEGEQLYDDTLDIVNDKPVAMTIHKSKGLEWQTVYVVGCTSGSFPYLGGGGGLQIPEVLRSTSQADSRLAEERRLMYVAATRARDELFLTHTSSSNSGKTTRKPSRFIDELGITPVSTEHLADEMHLERRRKVEKPNIALPLGMIEGDSVVLSASQAEDYLMCPLNFYYKHVLGVPEEETHQAAVGSLYHDIIESINQAKIDQTEVPKIVDILHRLQTEWPEIGYSSMQQRERDLRDAIEGFPTLYERLIAEPAPIAVEKKFRVQIPESHCILKGRIDAVMLAGNDEVIMCDYKTSTSVTDSDKAKDKTTKSKQLTMYALAWYLLTGEDARQVRLDFVRTGYIGTVKKMPRSIETMQSNLAEAAEAILAGSFDPGAEHEYCIHPKL
jgi:DNA helicase-2/ATP-dependent DNA helicase PcrA